MGRACGALGRLWLADSIGAILISVYIIYSWARTGLEQLDLVIGRAADPAFLVRAALSRLASLIWRLIWRGGASAFAAARARVAIAHATQPPVYAPPLRTLVRSAKATCVSVCACARARRGLPRAFFAQDLVREMAETHDPAATLDQIRAYHFGDAQLLD